MAYGLENTIVVKGMGHHEEGVCDEICTPGMGVEMAADGKYDLATSVVSGGVKVVKEDALQGKTKDNAYAVDDQLFIYQPVPGDHLLRFCKSGEDISVADRLVLESGTGLFIKTSTAQEQNIQLTEMKVHDAMSTVLPAAAANDDMGLITGTPGTDGPTLQGVDFGGTSSDEKTSFEYVLPLGYKAGGTITLRLRGAVLTTLSDDTCTIDAEVWLADEDGAVGSDICATAAQSINSLTIADKDFTITPTGLVPGDKLIIRLAFICTDAGDLGVMIPELSKVSILADLSVGNALFESLESTAGALAANDHVKARCLRV